MKINHWWGSIGAAVVLLAIAAHAGGAGSPRAIVPGKSVGRTELGMSREQVQRLLGSRAQDDAAMGGKVWVTWFSYKGRALNGVSVYFTARLMNGEPRGTQIAHQIQVTSDYFRTEPGGISPRISTLAQIRRAFPHIVKSPDNAVVLGELNPSKAPLDFYDDTKRGIGFVVTQAKQPDRGVCKAIIVHDPGTPGRVYEFQVNPE